MRRVWLVLLAGVMGSACSGGSGLNEETGPSPVVARINGDAVYRSELDGYRKTFQNPSGAYERSESSVLETLLEIRLVQDELRRRRIALPTIGPAPAAPAPFSGAIASGVESREGREQLLINISYKASYDALEDALVPGVNGAAQRGALIAFLNEAWGSATIEHLDQQVPPVDVPYYEQ